MAQIPSSGRATRRQRRRSDRRVRQHAQAGRFLWVIRQVGVIGGPASSDEGRSGAGTAQRGAGVGGGTRRSLHEEVLAMNRLRERSGRGALAAFQRRRRARRRALLPPSSACAVGALRGHGNGERRGGGGVGCGQRYPCADIKLHGMKRSHFRLFT